MHPGKVEITNTLNFVANIVIVLYRRENERTNGIYISLLLMGRQNNVAENVSVVDKVTHPIQCCNFVPDTLKKLIKYLGVVDHKWCERL